MDFDDAIYTHAGWKVKLNLYLRKPDGTLNPNDIHHDDRCALGKWLNGEGRRFAGTPEYTELKKEHTHFHRCAADIVRKANAGQGVTADTALGGDSDYARTSKAVVLLITKMKRKVLSPA